MGIDRRRFLQNSSMAAAGIGAGMAATAPRVSAAAQAVSESAPSIRVTGYKTILVDNIDPPIGHRKWLFIQLETDQGIVGLGERTTGGATNLDSQIALLSDMCDRHVVGQNPFHIERIWQNIFTTPHDYRHPSLHGTPAISAIEMALWDIVGKATNQPIYNLLGGRFHERLRAYAYLDTAGVWENPGDRGRAGRRAGRAGHHLLQAGSVPADHGWAARLLADFHQARGPHLPRHARRGG